jgi:hypothetical protein
LIDKDRSLSAPPDIRRFPKDGKYGVRWKFLDLSATRQSLTVPETSFSAWKQWDSRNSLKLATAYGGVYIFGRFTSAPSRRAKTEPALPKNVVYVGETHSLNYRPLTAHDKLRRYVQMFGDALFEDLYVSVFRIFRRKHSHRLLYRRYTEYLERKLIWEYTKHYGIQPALHFKETRKRK